jgi:iron(III) transport system substrate-binding protein
MTRAQILLLLASAAALATVAWLLRGGDALVVYCAHDLQLAEPLLEAFTAQTGIRLHVVYDTEATKSLGLVERVIGERAAPRADVLWGNEPLGAMRLADLDLLEPWRGAGCARIPAAWQDPQARWVGFAARLRVWLTAAELRGVSEAELRAPFATVSEPDALRHVALAVPLYGTTRFHFTALWALWGPERTRASLGRWRQAGVRWVRGNAAVKDLIVAGAAQLGWTDTDDAFAATARGEFGVQPVRVAVGDEPGRVLCVPNVVAIVRGTRRPAQARALVDFLLSQASELALARGAGAQVPLGPVDPAALPPRVRALCEVLPDAVPLAAVAAAHAEALAWLREEFVGR